MYLESLQRRVFPHDLHVISKSNPTEVAKAHTPINVTEINEARELVHHAEENLHNEEARFFSYLQQLRTINSEEFGAQREYASDYRQLLEMTNEYKADLSEYEAVFKVYEKYMQKDKDLKDEAEKQSRLHQKLQELAQVDQTQTG